MGNRRYAAARPATSGPMGLALALILALTMLPGALGAAATGAASATVLLDSAPVPLDTQPEVIGGRTMAPFRGIFEALGYTVSWDGESQTVTAVKGGVWIVMQIGSSRIQYGETVVESDAAPLIRDGRTLVPVRVIGELSGYDVLWNGDTRTVLIYSKLAEGATPQRFNYPYMISDGAYLYKARWADGSAKATVRISLADLSAEELFPYGANDYIIRAGVLYGRFGPASPLSYGAYDLASGELRDVTGFDVGACYIYEDKLYYTDVFGPYGTTLYRTGLEGGEAEKLMTGGEGHPLGEYTIRDGILFGGYMDTAFMMPLDTMEPVDITALCGLKSTRLMLGGMAVAGDCFYVSLSRYLGMTLAPFGILRYNYKTAEWDLLETGHVVEELLVTDNSIYYSVKDEGGPYDHYTHRLYRADAHGGSPVLLVEGAYSEWLVSGNFLYFTIPVKGAGTAVARVGTDGSRYQIVAAVD
ncbi:MAG: stalk domain-containing protein [Clostridiales bacterium]|nr:stalk domain-containing protein [Clostridiales bacterium]